MLQTILLSTKSSGIKPIVIGLNVIFCNNHRLCQIVVNATAVIFSVSGYSHQQKLIFLKVQGVFSQQSNPGVNGGGLNEGQKQP